MTCALLMPFSPAWGCAWLSGAVASVAFFPTLVLKRTCETCETCETLLYTCIYIYIYYCSVMSFIIVIIIAISIELYMIITFMGHPVEGHSIRISPMNRRFQPAIRIVEHL